MFRIYLLLIVLSGLLILTSCSSPDIAVISLDSGEILHPSYSEMRQVVIQIDKYIPTFTTIVRQELDLILKTYDSSCNLLSERHLPLFIKSYCGRNEYAISPDNNKIVYLKNNNLHLLNITLNNEKVLWENIADTSLEIPKIIWLNDSDIIIILRDYSGSDRKTNEISIFNINNLSKKVLYSPTYLSSFHYSFSPSNQWLAFEDGTEKHSIYGKIKILSVQSGELIAELGSGNKIIGNPCWDSDGTELVYIEGNKILIWSSLTRESRVLKTFHDDFIIYTLIYLKDKVGYIGGSSRSYNNNLVILDSKSGKKLHIIKSDFNGRVFALDESDTIIGEIGY